ncbi:MAG TPA: amino acid aminotransferase [Victivallales bacterium]|nr:amino acid aminotransferase [Victivallales bacterium]
MFENIEMAPADSILGLTDAFKKDTSSNKINLGVGVYKDDTGITPILESVKKAEKVIYDQENSKSYLGIAGTEEYGKLVRELIFTKESKVLEENRAVTVQSPGGTGALRIAADFIHKFLPDAKLWLSNPTWANHNAVFSAAGIETDTYTYYDTETKGLNFEGMIQDLSTIPAKDVVLIHACCHNPTGVDIAPDQWGKVAEVAKQQGFLVLFDFAYQGFGNGIDEDAVGIRLFADKIKNFMVANSFSKNFGLYNERIGALTVVADTEQEAKNVFSQLKVCVRSNFSNPPAHGSSIVSKILSDPYLYELWKHEVTEMRNRINSNRSVLVETLKSKGVKHDFDFINKQRGMFSYTGLTKDQVLELRNKFSVYMVNSGRISLAGINNKNLDAFCEAVAKVL